MRKTAEQLIAEKYGELFPGEVASTKSAVEKLEEIGRSVYEGRGIVQFEDDPDEKIISEDQFFIFLKELALAHHENLELLRKIIALARHEKGLILKILKEQKDEKKQNDYNQTIAQYIDSHFVLPVPLLQGDSSANHPSSSSQQQDNAQLIPKKPSSIPGNPSLSFFSVLNSANKNNVYDVNIESDRNVKELEETKKKLIKRLLDYLKMREKNPNDGRLIVNFWRNAFHNKKLTLAKVRDARSLIGVLEERGISAFCEKLSISIQANMNDENNFLPFKLYGKGGEYGKCLEDCRNIVKNKNWALMEFKKNICDKVRGFVRAGSLGKANGASLIDKIVQAKSRDKVKRELSSSLNKREDLLNEINPQPTKVHSSVNRRGALKIGD